MDKTIPLHLPTIQHELTHERLLEVIQPSVHHIRRELFENEKTPFGSYRAATRWIERTARREGMPRRRSRKQRAELREQVRSQTAGLGSIHYKVPVLEYLTSPSAPHNSPKRLAVRPTSSLADLSFYAKEIAGVTGWREADVVMLILIGRRPETPQNVLIEVNSRDQYLPGDVWLRRKTVSLIVHDASMTEAQWRSARQQLRAEFQSARWKAFSDKDRILYDVVQEFGESPERDKTAHWQRIADECNRRFGKRWFANYRGPYIQWKKRLRPRIARLVGVSTGGSDAQKT